MARDALSAPFPFALTPWPWVPGATPGVVAGMGLVNRAGPDVEKQADQVAEAACELADAAAGYGWSAAAADDALVAIDTLAAALAQVDPEVREVLAAVTTVTGTARRRLGLPVETEGTDPSTTTMTLGVSGPRTGRRPRRSGRGPGFQGIR
ncbi:hypothetical protein ACWGQ4_02385 [Streptomyces sp. NPDC055721]|uniref:hypothetical protein n=1 Tax=Streptomyces sp. NPDC127132 TaxID=3345374 RepID=UPI0036253CA0